MVTESMNFKMKQNRRLYRGALILLAVVTVATFSLEVGLHCCHHAHQHEHHRDGDHGQAHHHHVTINVRSIDIHVAGVAFDNVSSSRPVQATRVDEDASESIENSRFATNTSPAYLDSGDDYLLNSVLIC